MLGLLRKKETLVVDAGLDIRTPDGVTLLSIPSEVVSVFRRMVTGLQFRETLPPCTALTAALRFEGVTYNTLALATTLASDTGARVCAVETNWLAPGMYQQLAFEPQPKRRRKDEEPPVARIAATPGLAGLIDSSATLDEALIATEQSNLKLLPAGSLAPERRPGLVRSTTLRDTLNSLSEQFDYVLLDVPAVLASSDGIALASLGEACCFIVRQGVTPGTQVQQALDEIKHMRMLGVVLNQVQIHTPRFIRNFIPQE
jgi:Mrp family chromosome partitioning ATPase